LDTIEDYKTYDFLRESIASFIHNFKIDEKFRNNGYGLALKKEIEKIAKQHNYQFISSIVNVKNIVSQHINKKLEYKVLKTDENYDFFFKKI
jgi:ribosomal protein S18 acetylase RimI-like enzyme